MAGERENRILESPLYEFVRKGWRKWSQKILSVQVRDEDFLLYLAWALDTVKQQDGDVNAQFRDIVFSSLRDKFILSKFTSNGEDLSYLTNLVCASALACIGLTLKESSENKRIFSELVYGLGEHWETIRKMKHSVDVDTDIDGLQEWMIDYMGSGLFYTFSDEIDWDEDNMAMQVIRRSKSFDKVDLFRVIMALYKKGAFEAVDGEELTASKVFQAFGDMLGEDYSKFNNNLSAASANKNDVGIFKSLERGFIRRVESIIAMRNVMTPSRRTMAMNSSPQEAAYSDCHRSNTALKSSCCSEVRWNMMSELCSERMRWKSW